MRIMATAALITLFLFTALFPCLADSFIDLRAIKTIESNGNPFAFNARTKCYGLYQISEVCLQEFNALEKKDYRLQDLFDSSVNEEIAGWYFERLQYMLDHYGIKVNVTTVLASYNWGIGNVVRWYRAGGSRAGLPAETRAYIDKYVLLSAEDLL